MNMKSIVIIEDHPVMRKGLTSYFTDTRRWLVLGSASSIVSAKEMLNKVTLNSMPDVLLLDIQLEDGINPSGWGLDIIPWLKIHLDAVTRLPAAPPPATPMPLLAVYSTFDDYAHVSAALSLGVKAYVTKRHSEQELEAALLKAFNGEVFIDEAAKMSLQNVSILSCLLTKREAEILNSVKVGLSNKQIAENLNISHRTVENILSCIYDKTGIKSRSDLERL